MNKLVQVDIGESFFGGTHPLRNLSGLGGFANVLLSNAIVIAGIVMIFLIVIGGISMITGAGSGNPQRVSRGREIIFAAIIGFMIVLAAYWIVLLVGRSTGTNLIQ